MNKGAPRFLILGLFGLYLAISQMAWAYTHFALVYEKPAGQKADTAEFRTISTFLNNLDLRLDNSIRFGVGRPVDVRFEGFEKNELVPNCDGFSADKYVQVDGNTLFINRQLVSHIEKRTMRDKLNGCSHYEALKLAVEKKLLSLPGAEDLDRPWKQSELADIQACDHMKKRKNDLRVARFNKRLQKECVRLSELRRRRRLYEAYEHKVGKVLYKTRMEFDPTSLSDGTLERYNICKRDYRPTKFLKNGTPVKALAWAIVYMAPGHQTSVMGHIAERYIFCVGDKLQDKLFEYTQVSAKENVELRNSFYNHLDKVNPEYLKSLAGSLFLKVKTHPNNQQLGHYGFFNFHSNRDVIEVYPKIDEMQMWDNLQELLRAWKKQKEDFLAMRPWPDYDLFKANCTHPVREKLNFYTGELDYSINNWQGLTPINIFGFLRKKTVDKIIIYPSQRVLRKYHMLENGKRLFWEHTTLWSQASGGKKGKGQGWVLLYPETHGFLNKLITNRAYGVINLGAAAMQTLYGIVSAPFKWLSKLPGVKPEKGENHLRNGFMGIGMSLSEIFPGIRMRYPAPTQWSAEEEEFIYGELIHQEPKVLDYLLEKVQQ